MLNWRFPVAAFALWVGMSSVALKAVNTLSFLDYLRDLVLSRSRQNFYAAADHGMAGPFERKFGFLGKDFRRYSLERA